MDYKKLILVEVEKAFLSVQPAQLQNVTDSIHCAGKVFCDGLGRSMLAMRGFAMRLMQLGFQGYVVGDAATPAFENGDLLLICTASGTSSVLLYHAEQTKKIGGTVAVITGNPKSLIAESADDIIMIPATNKDSIKSELTSAQPMGSLFEQTSQLVCDTLILMLMEQFNISADDMRKRHANIE
jgi:6-phospho-3-hexuloisomerase